MIIINKKNLIWITPLYIIIGIILGIFIWITLKESIKDEQFCLELRQRYAISKILKQEMGLINFEKLNLTEKEDYINTLKDIEFALTGFNDVILWECIKNG